MAPALFLLLFFALFPSIDLIGMGLSYCSCVSLNDLQLREACKLPKSLATDPKGPIYVTVPNNWRSTLVGGIGSTIQDPITDVSYDPGKGAIYVIVSTSVVVKPCFMIPFLPGVPGLGAPFTCNITHSRVLENPVFAAE